MTILPIRTFAAFVAVAATVGGSAFRVGQLVFASAAPVQSKALPVPVLPAKLYGYSDASVPLPPHFARDFGRGGGPDGRGGGRPGGRGPGGGRGPAVLSSDNTPASNPITDAGATLGRVLFYDVRLSANNTRSCASCHQQQFGFSDTARFSVGFEGGLTKRHSMSLANARFYRNGRFFWDERAVTLEDQVLMPVQDKVEMGMSLDVLVNKLRATSYYPALFTAAYGSAEISSDRIARALAQFVRAMVSAQAPIDSAFAGAPALSNEARFGQQLFNGRAGCERCHSGNAMIVDRARNNGLDITPADQGAGGATFKVPSLRNVAVRAPYMHDGRFSTLREVVDFYDSAVQNSPNLDPVLGRRGGGPGGRDGRGPGFGPGRGAQRLNLSEAEKSALVAFMESFTDPAFLTAPQFSDPFVRK